MRLRVAAVAVVLAGAVMAGIGGAGVPAGAAVGAAVAAKDGTAVAASGNPLLRIRAIDREGKPVAVTATLQRLNGSVAASLTTARAVSVPKGTYNVTTWVKEPGSEIRTLVDRELVVTKSATVTFDARQGRQILFGIADNPNTYLQALITIYSSPRNSTQYNHGGAPVYAIPGKLAPGFHLDLYAVLAGPYANTIPPGGANSPSNRDYILIKPLSGAIPGDLTFPYSTSKLVHDHVALRDLKMTAYTTPIDYTYFEMTPILPSRVIVRLPMDVLPLPFVRDYYLSPGYPWSAGADSGGSYGQLPATVGGASYSQTFDSAVYGPSPDFGPMVRKNMLETMPEGEYLLVAPTDWPKEGLASQQAWTMSSQTWLYQGSKLIGHGAAGGLAVKISAKPAWYTVRMRVTLPGADLYTSETDAYNFRARAGESTLNATDFWPRIIPAGLNLSNAAKASTQTTVPIWFSTLSGNIAAHNVKVWSSVDGGKSWMALHPVASGNHWTVVVTNPAVAGHVSLRVQGTNASGFTASVTVINAYAVS